MAEKSDTEQRIKRGAARTVSNVLLFLISLGVIVAWASTGLYRLELGEAAIIMNLGRFDRIERREGLSWHLPEPLEFDIPVNVSEIRSLEFGMKDGETPTLGDDGERTDADGTYAGFVQTADNNIVSISYELQYSVNNPYAFSFGMVQPDQILHDATESAVRQVIGGKTIDNVLIYEKQKIELEARAILQRILLSYASLIIHGDAELAADIDPEIGTESPFVIRKISLQTVHPPAQVRGAFEDVKAAQQDEDRSMSRAKGDAREIIEASRAKASELEEGSQAYKQTRILESQGEAARFTALVEEYRLAPSVMRERLYIEAMEEILPKARKMLIEPGSAGVVPLLTGAAVPSLSKPAVEVKQ